MSYKGYEEHLCKNGHYFTGGDDYYYCKDTLVCPQCHSKTIPWTHSVNVTNGSYLYEDDFGGFEAIGVSFKDILFRKLLAPVCSKCLQPTGPAIYYIPTEKEWVEPTGFDKRIHKGLEIG